MTSTAAGGDSSRELLESVIFLLTRDLQTLAREVEAYPSESDLWVVRGDIPNSAGNLALHLVGNLNHFVGTVLGKTGFIRDRDREFSATDLPSELLLGGIRETEIMVRAVLSAFPTEGLHDRFPSPPPSMRGISTARFLCHLTTHLAYHLGQINYHRRLTAAEA